MNTNLISPADQKAWDAFLTQSLIIVHEVSPSTPIGDIYAASYKLFQTEKFIIPHITGNVSEGGVSLVLPEKTVNEIAYLNSNQDMDIVKSSNQKIKSKSSKKANVQNEKPRKLSQYNIFLKHYLNKMKNNTDVSHKDKVKAIAEKWRNSTPKEREHFMQKHGHEFDEQ